jgi:hypothetical protein
MKDSTSKDYIFLTVDPLNNIVYLTNERWNEHILPEHVELYGEEKLIQKTIEDPDSIYLDKEFECTHIYYYEHKKIELSYYGNYLKVVVGRELQGQILTAYIDIKSKENTKEIYIKNE